MILRIRTPDGGNFDDDRGPSLARMHRPTWELRSAEVIGNMRPVIVGRVELRAPVGSTRKAIYLRTARVPLCGAPLRGQGWNAHPELVVDACARRMGHRDSHRTAAALERDAERRRSPR